MQKERSKKVLREVLIVIISFFAISFIAFSLSSFSRGDIALYVLSESATEEAAEALRTSSGIAKPFIIRFFEFLKDFFALNWGENLQGYSIRRLIAERANITLSLMVLTLLFSLPLSILLSCFSIKREHGFLDRFSDLFILASYSLPSFSIALILILVFAFYIPLFPISGYSSFRSLILPSITLSIMHSSLFIRVLKKSLKREMKEGYIKAAIARGKRSEFIVFTKALRPASLTLSSLSSSAFSTLIAGSVVVETVFSLPGIGSLIVSATLSRDSSTTTTILMLSSLLVSLSAIASNIVNGILDPRSRGSDE